jgi:hypothetical protein
MFKTWYDNLDEHTKAYLKKQPIWHDKDMVGAFVVGLLLGFAIGWML